MRPRLSSGRTRPPRSGSTHPARCGGRASARRSRAAATSSAPAAPTPAACTRAGRTPRDGPGGSRRPGDLAERLQRRRAADAADAARASGAAPKGQVALPVVGGGVDVHPARSDRFGEAQPRPRSRVKTEVRRPKGDPLATRERLDVISHLDHRRHRAERLLRGDQHRRCHLVEHGRLPEEAVGNPSALPPPVTTRAPARTASPTCSSVFAATPSLLSGPMVVAGSKGSPSGPVR